MTGAHAVSPSRSHLLRYSSYGISIRSELPLPLPEARERALFEVEFRRVNRSISRTMLKGVKRQRYPGSYFEFRHLRGGASYVRWDGIGEALISRDGRSITCHAFREACSESLNFYLLGQALSFALVKNGLEPLHATAVVVAGNAIVFLGDCGVGKSSLAAAFLQAGHRLLTDDLLLLRRTAQGLMAYPGPPRIKLFPEMARKVLGGIVTGDPMNPQTRKLIISLNQDCACATPVPVRALYVLASPDRTAHEVRIRIVKLSRREAFVRLLASAFNYVILDPDRLRRQFEATRVLANAITAKTLSYPRSVESLPLVREAIVYDICAKESEGAICGA